MESVHAVHPHVPSALRDRHRIPSALRPHFGLIYNPRSSRNFGALPPRFSGLLHAAPSTTAELRAALAEFARREVNVVVVSGGDGTVREVLTALPSAYRGAPSPALAILAAGTTDLIAGEVGGCVDRLDVERLVARARAGALVRTRRPVLRVERAVDERGETISVRGMVLGAGIFSHATDLGQRISREQGTSHASMIVRTVALLVRRLVLEGDPDGLLLGQSIGLRALEGPMRPSAVDKRFLVLVSGLRERLFLGRTPFWGAASDDELRYVSIAGPARNITRSFAALAMNRPWLAGEDWTSGSSTALALDTRHPFVIDGELFHPPAEGAVRIHADPPVTFLSP